MIETAKIVNMCISGVFALLLPIVLLIVWRRKTHASLLSALVGALTFVVFVYVLENLLHQVCLFQDTAVSRFLNANAWAYCLYGALAAGVFEETGRLVAFSLLLRKKRARQNSVMYGIGHGGIEAILVCTLSMATMIAYALTLNASGADALLSSMPEQARESMAAVITTLTDTPASSFLASGFERFSAVVLHIALSVLVFAAVRQKGKRWLYPVAIGLHALVDAVAVALFQSGTITNVALMETVVFLLAAGVAVFAYFVYRGLPAEDNAVSTPAAEKTDDAAPSAPQEA